MAAKKKKKATKKKKKTTKKKKKRIGRFAGGRGDYPGPQFGLEE